MASSEFLQEGQIGAADLPCIRSLDAFMGVCGFPEPKPPYA